MIKRTDWSDLMIDIEALGPSPTGVITQIAAVPFDIKTGEWLASEYFNQYIDVQSNLDCGRTVDGSTIDWWFKQDKAAINQVYNTKTKKADLPSALISLKVFIEISCKKKPNIWSHSTYDFVMIQNALVESCKLKQLSYQSSRDIRTLNAIYTLKTNKEKTDKIEFVGTKHNAVDDCVHQIKYCSTMMKEVLK